MSSRKHDAKLKGEAFQVIDVHTADIAELREQINAGEFVMVVPADMKSSAELRMHIHLAHRYDTTDLRTYKRLVSEHAKMHTPEWAHPDTRPHLHDPQATSISLLPAATGERSDPNTGSVKLIEKGN